MPVRFFLPRLGLYGLNFMQYVLLYLPGAVALSTLRAAAAVMYNRQD